MIKVNCLETHLLNAVSGGNMRDPGNDVEWGPEKSYLPWEQNVLS